MSDSAEEARADSNRWRRSASRDVVGANSPGIVRRIVERNNAMIRDVDGGASNPRPVADLAWARRLRDRHPAILREWDAFVERGLRLPLAEELLDGPQGNEVSWWRTGVLMVRGRPCRPLADCFPETMTAFSEVPGVSSLMISAFGPGTELPEHRGDNAGGLRLLYGVVCPAGAGHSLNGRPITIDPGAAVVFDDTEPHAAWNRSDAVRVMVLGDLIRPLHGAAAVRNGAVQWARTALSSRYRALPRRGAELHRALNEPG